MTRSHRPLLLLFLALGLAPLGCGGTPTGPTDTAPSAEPAPPKVDVPGGTLAEAGEVDYAVPRDFVFPVSNTGGAPLELTLLRKSCSCAKVELPAQAIAPGGQGKVTVSWTPKPGQTDWSPKPGQVEAPSVTVTVATNDPKTKEFQFTVKAHIKPLVHFLIEGKEDAFYVDFGNDPIRPGEARVRELQLFSTELPEFDLDVTCPLPGLKVSKEKLSAGAPVDEAKCGYKVELTATKDLPVGYVRTDLHITLRKLGQAPDRTLILPVYAVSGTGVVTVRQPGLFQFTKPKMTDGDTARIDVTFDVPTGNENIAVESVEPKFVQVDTPQKVSPGRWRITAHLPKDDPEAAKLQVDPPMEGQVVLKVAGLDRPVPVRVKWDPLPR
jgi:hypothetical protein